MAHVSMLEWLNRQKQTPGAIERFWRVVLVSALYEELDKIDAQYGDRCVVEGGSHEPHRLSHGSAQRVRCGTLYEACKESIEKARRGSEPTKPSTWIAVRWEYFSGGRV